VPKGLTVRFRVDFGSRGITRALKCALRNCDAILYEGVLLGADQFLGFRLLEASGSFGMLRGRIAGGGLAGGRAASRRRCGRGRRCGGRGSRGCGNASGGLKETEAQTGGDGSQALGSARIHEGSRIASQDKRTHEAQMKLA
jgi:hypothetical protein